jgi:hypothetical protein
MTPEQRLDRAEYILVRLAKSGREARSEFRQKINILIQAQMETTEQIKGLATGQARADREMADLRRSQKLTDEALRAFINSQRKEKNGT